MTPPASSSSRCGRILFNFARWYCPRSFTFPACEIDPRPGGGRLIVFGSPDGVEFTNKGVYLEFTPPERLVLPVLVLDKEGTTLLESTVTVTFLSEGAKTGAGPLPHRPRW